MNEKQLSVTGDKSPENPFAKTASRHINAGTVEIESSRAIAEAQGKLVIAKRFPRDESLSYSKVIESCRRPGLASEATYSFPRGGKAVTGPSIRLAEELARVWGNIDYGIRELSRKDGVSEMESYAWDLETNTSSSQKFSVKHWRDTQSGGYELKDERDIYELTANQGARRLRARLLAILPPDLVDGALNQCRATLAGNSEEPVADRVRKMLDALAKFGVIPSEIQARLGHSLDECTPDELADLRGIYNSLKQNMTKKSDWFGLAKDERRVSTGAVAAALDSVEAQPVQEKKTREPKKAVAPEAEPSLPAEPPTNDDNDIFG